MAKSAEEKPAEVTHASSPGGQITLWKKPNKPVTLSIPSHWESDPNCGEYMTTLDESDPKQARMVALALAGKTKSGKDSQNKKFSVIGLTICPFLSAKNDNGDQSSKIGFFLHTEKEIVFVAHYHAKSDILALVGRYGVPTKARPVEVVIDPVPDAKTYRVLAADLVDG
jgi:hypothetical protein